MVGGNHIVVHYLMTSPGLKGQSNQNWSITPFPKILITASTSWKSLKHTTTATVPLIRNSETGFLTECNKQRTRGGMADNRSKGFKSG